MKTLNLLILIILLFATSNFVIGQEERVEFVDIAKEQVYFLNKYKNKPEDIRNKVFVDSIYKPHQEILYGYAWEEPDFLDWMNNDGYNQLDDFNKKMSIIDSKELQADFFRTLVSMEEFTGYEAKGKWFILFGPGWTNLGSLGDGDMVIDLANHYNDSAEAIKKFFPHEINHQIYDVIESRPKGNAVISRIIDEGFACYVSHLFHEGKYTIAQELVYTEDGYKACQKQENGIIKEKLKKHYKSNDEKIARAFASRGTKISEDLPSAIAYYIGFRIVEEFVKMNGKDSWKLIYTMKPEEVLEKSLFLQ